MATDSDPPEEQTSEQRRLSRLEKRVAVIEVAIGEAADPITKTPATGLVGAVVGVQTAVEALTAALTTEERARTERRAFWVKVGWGLGLPVGVSALLGAGALLMRWILSLHH